MSPPSDPPVDMLSALNSYPAPARLKLLQIRHLILQTAAENPGIGSLTETLKWGEPAFLTEQTKSGSTIRMAWKPALPNQVGLYFNCQTTLVETMRHIYPDSFTYQKNRAVLMPFAKPLPETEIRHICEMAMTYHLNSGKSK